MDSDEDNDEGSEMEDDEEVEDDNNEGNERINVNFIELKDRSSMTALHYAA